MTSMCTALVDMHSNSKAHCLLSALPPLVCLAVTDHGPKTSIPMSMKGGAAVTGSEGRSASCCCTTVLLSSRQAIQAWITELMSFFLPPITHRPSAKTDPSLKWDPWCLTYSWWWQARSLDMWWFLGMRRFFTLVSSCAFFCWLPILMSPASSSSGLSLKRGLLLKIGFSCCERCYLLSKSLVLSWSYYDIYSLNHVPWSLRRATSVPFSTVISPLTFLVWASNEDEKTHCSQELTPGWKPSVSRTFVTWVCVTQHLPLSRT